MDEQGSSCSARIKTSPPTREDLGHKTTKFGRLRKDMDERGSICLAGIRNSPPTREDLGHKTTKFGHLCKDMDEPPWHHPQQQGGAVRESRC